MTTVPAINASEEIIGLAGLSNENAKQLAVITPAIMGPAYFRETREMLVEAAKTKTPPDFARMADIFRRNGMTVAAPPAKPGLAGTSHGSTGVSDE